MKKLITLSSALAVLVSLVFPISALAKKAHKASAPKEKTWVVSISESGCKTKHDMHNGSARECTLKCVKEGGKYVLVKGSTVYDVANQDFAGLGEHAGEKVRVTGTKEGNTITVTQITIPASAKKVS